MSWRDLRRPTPLARDLDLAHRQGVNAAGAGLCDAGLGAARLTGDGVPLLAEAAVTSATPFLRAPLLTRLSGVRRLHPTGSGDCPTCAVPAPCPTALEVGA
ncbi:MAG TPA: hypothetical protein VF661_07610 [Actinomycetales bacterium]|jgi:hypothetical protein